MSLKESRHDLKRRTSLRTRCSRARLRARASGVADRGANRPDFRDDPGLETGPPAPACEPPPDPAEPDEPPPLAGADPDEPLVDWLDCPLVEGTLAEGVRTVGVLACGVDGTEGVLTCGVDGADGTDGTDGAEGVCTGGRFGTGTEAPGVCGSCAGV